MSRINTNVSSLIAQRVLRRNNDDLNKSLERLSTGLKINKGADNPAGLIASENLRAEKAGIAKAIDNAERASNIIGTAEGGLGTSADLIVAAAMSVDRGAGVALLADLGSSVLTVKSLIAEGEMPPGALLVDAPFVEGAVSALVTASAGAPLEAVAASAAEAYHYRKA